MIKKVLLFSLRNIFKNISKRTQKKGFLINLIINDANYSIGKGFGGTNSINFEIKESTKFIENHDSPLIIDVGAHKGNYSDKIIEKFPNARIHCFEPSITNYHFLTNKFTNNNNIKINNLGISDVTQETILYSDNDGSSLASIYKREISHFGKQFDSEENIKVIKFEDYWKDKLNKEKIDLIKLDIEGNELNALSGLGESISKIKCIQFEFGGANIDSKTYFQDFWYFFKDKNFDIKRITPFGTLLIDTYTEDEEYFKTTNYVAINKLVL